MEARPRPRRHLRDDGSSRKWRRKRQQQSNAWLRPRSCRISRDIAFIATHFTTKSVKRHSYILV